MAYFLSNDPLVPVDLSLCVGCTCFKEERNLITYSTIHCTCNGIVHPNYWQWQRRRMIQKCFLWVLTEKNRFMTNLKLNLTIKFLAFYLCAAPQWSKLSNQEVIEVQTFGSKSRALINVLHYLFRNYAYFEIYSPIFRGLKVIRKRGITGNVSWNMSCF